MEKTDLESKYQKLAGEYSKVRSHATVLKKAVLDEQAKILNLKEVIKEQEQKIRKHDQEMESLTFRNEQLTKRIYVLQQELQASNSGGKKSKSRAEAPSTNSLSVFDEELQKKIMENAQLVSAMADKEMELSNYREKAEWLEEKLGKLQVELAEKSAQYKEQLEKRKAEKRSSNSSLNNCQIIRECEKCKDSDDKSIDHWRREVDRWKTECDLLRSKPESDEQLTEYYESQIRDLIEAKQLSQSECGSLHADNGALKSRLERAELEKSVLEAGLETSREELQTTNENYRIQLDAMTEHLAAQNEKITKQCDEIQILRHRLSQKK